MGQRSPARVGTAERIEEEAGESQAKQQKNRGAEKSPATCRQAAGATNPAWDGGCWVGGIFVRNPALAPLRRSLSLQAARASPSVVRYVRHHAVRQPGTGHGDGLFREQLFVPGFEPVRALLRRHSTGRAARPDGVDDCRRGGVAILTLCEALLQELEPHVLPRLRRRLRRRHAAIVDAIRTSCPTCRVATQQCPDRLEPGYEKLLSEEPVAMPSSRLPHGVVAYVSDNEGLALGRLQRKRTLSGASAGFRTICHHPTPPSHAGFVAPAACRHVAGDFSPTVFLLFGLAFAGFLFIRSAVPHARWGALAHGYFPSARERGRSNPLAATTFLRFRNRMLKRSFDILVTAILLLILAPVFLCAVVFLLLTEGRPIFYISTRYIGLTGRFA